MADPNFNDRTADISVNIGDMYDNSVFMMKDLTALEEHWTYIMKTWADLKLSWVGKTQQEVDEFTTRINEVQDKIFGQADPNDSTKLGKPGLYQLLAGVAESASQAYYWTDWSVGTVFAQMSAQLTGKPVSAGLGPYPQPSEQPGGPPASSLDPWTLKPAPPSEGPAGNQDKPYITETF